MKILKKKKGLYAYNGTDGEAVTFLNAFKGVFGIDLLPYLNNKPIDFGDLLRTFDEDGVSNLRISQETDELNEQIDNGNLALLQKLNGQEGSIIGYIYELKNWYTNKLAKGKVVLIPAGGFGVNYKKAYYVYIADKMYTPAQKLAMFNKEFETNFLQLGGIKANKSAASINAWESLINRNAEENEKIYYKGFYNDYMAWYKAKRSTVSIGSVTKPTDGQTANENPENTTPTVEQSENMDFTETDASAFLQEIEKYSPLGWDNLQYWYKNLLEKKKEVSIEVYNWAYGYWLNKLNAEYATFAPLKKETEKEKHDLINGYKFAKTKNKKRGVLAAIISLIFNKK
jgi:hypothetical protein